jgi:hypothetical protein
VPLSVANECAAARKRWAKAGRRTRLSYLGDVEIRSYAARRVLTLAARRVLTLRESGRSELHLQANATAPPVPISPIEIHHVIAARFLALAVAIGSRGQDTPIHATESYQAFTACWKFVRGGQLVEGERW